MRVQVAGELTRDADNRWMHTKSRLDGAESRSAAVWLRGVVRRQQKHGLLPDEVVQERRHFRAERVTVRRKRERALDLRATTWHNSRKSRIVQKWMLGVSYHDFGQVPGHRHAAVEKDLPANTPMPEIRKRDDHMARNSQELLQHGLGMLRGLQRLAQDRIIEGLVGIVDRSRSASPWITERPFATQKFTPDWLSSTPRPST